MKGNRIDLSLEVSKIMEKWGADNGGRNMSNTLDMWQNIISLYTSKRFDAYDYASKCGPEDESLALALAIYELDRGEEFQLEEPKVEAECN